MANGTNENYVKDIVNKEWLNGTDVQNLRDDFDFSQFDQNIEKSFEKFLEEKQSKFTGEATKDELQPVFNEWLDSNLTVLDQIRDNDIAQNIIKPFSFELQNFETASQLAIFQQQLQQEKDQTKETTTLNVWWNELIIDTYKDSATNSKVDKNDIAKMFNEKNFDRKSELLGFLKSGWIDNVKKFQRIIDLLAEDGSEDDSKWKQWLLWSFWVDGKFWWKTMDAFKKYVEDHLISAESETQSVEPNNAPDAWEKGWVLEDLRPVDDDETTDSGTDDDFEVDSFAWSWWTWSWAVETSVYDASDDGTDTDTFDVDNDPIGNGDDVSVENYNPDPDDYEDVSVDDDTEVESESWTDLPAMWNVEILYEWIAYSVDKESLKQVDSDEKAVKLMTTARVGLLMKKAFSITDVNYKPRWQELKDLRKVKHALLDCDNPVDLFNDFFKSYNKNESYSSDNKKLNKLYKLYKEYKDDQNGNKKWPYFTRLMWLLEKYFVQWINDENWKRIETFKDLYNNELLWLNKEIKIKKKKSAERKANKNMTDEERKLFNEWWWTALDSLNTKKIMELSSDSLKEFKDRYPEFKSLDELQFALTLSDMNADGRVDSQDFEAKTGQEIWSLYRDAMVDAEYWVIEQWPMKNLISYARDYAGVMWYKNTAKVLEWIDLNWNAESIMKQIKEYPLVMQYFRTLLAKTPKWVMENILKYGVKQETVETVEGEDFVTNEMVTELMAMPEFEKKFDEIFKDLANQWLDDTREIRNAWRPIVATAILYDPNVKRSISDWWINVWLAKALWKNWKWWNIALTLWYAMMGDIPVLGATASYWKTWNLGKTTRLNTWLSAWAWVTKWWVIIAAVWNVWVDQMLNNKQLNNTLDVRAAHYLWISGHVWVWAQFDMKDSEKNHLGLRAQWALSYSNDRMKWIMTTYENIKNSIWDTLDKVMKDNWSNFNNKDECIANIKKSLEEQYGNSEQETLDQAAKNIYAWLAYYLMWVEDPTKLTDEQKKNIVSWIAESYAQQWRNEAMKNLNWKVGVERISIWAGGGFDLKELAKFVPIVSFMISFEWYNNLYAHESKESMENYAQQLNSGQGMREVNNSSLYEYKSDWKNWGITQKWIDYLNTKMAIMDSRMNVPGLKLEIQDVEVDMNGIRNIINAVKIPKDLCKYVNININKELKDYVQSDSEWNILVPSNLPIALMTYSRTNTWKYHLIIWDTKVSDDDIHVWLDSKFNWKIENFEWLKWEITKEDVNKRLRELWPDCPISSCVDIDKEWYVCLRMDVSKNIVCDDGTRYDENNIFVHKHTLLQIEKSADGSYKIHNTIYKDLLPHPFKIEYYPNWMYSEEAENHEYTLSSDEILFENTEIDAIFDSIEKKLSAMDGEKRNWKYATFMNAAADANIDGVLDNGDYDEAFKNLNNLLQWKLNDPCFDWLKGKLVNPTDEEKVLIVDRFKAIFSYNDKLVNKWCLKLQVRDRWNAYENLFWYDKSVEFPLKWWNYRENIVNQFNVEYPWSDWTANQFRRNLSPNLIWMTAFYRLGNGDRWRSYMFTELWWTNVLWWVTKEIVGDSELEATKEWFTKNLDKSTVHQNMIISALTKKILEKTNQNVSITWEQLKDILLWNSVDIWLENDKISIKREPKYIFYLLWECANESIWVLLDNINITHTTLVTTWSAEMTSIEVDGTPEWLYVNTVDASNNIDLHDRHTVTVWTSVAIKSEFNWYSGMTQQEWDTWWWSGSWDSGQWWWTGWWSWTWWQTTWNWWWMRP